MDGIHGGQAERQRNEHLLGMCARSRLRWRCECSRTRHPSDPSLPHQPEETGAGYFQDICSYFAPFLTTLARGACHFWLPMRWHTRFMAILEINLRLLRRRHQGTYPDANVNMGNASRHRRNAEMQSNTEWDLSIGCERCLVGTPTYETELPASCRWLRTLNAANRRP